ncbi:TPA: hypothetical protein HA265_01975 [Candidatus Woesearchaeota archaeon]|nr:hypothetical protein [Candidatus Woesearchaeota archaeon]
MTGDIGDRLEKRLIDAEFKDEEGIYYLVLRGTPLEQEEIQERFLLPEEVAQKTGAKTVDLYPVKETYEAFIEIGEGFDPEQRDKFAQSLASLFADQKVVFRYSRQGLSNKKGLLLFSRALGQNGIEPKDFQAMIMDAYTDFDRFSQHEGKRVNMTDIPMVREVITPELLKSGRSGIFAEAEAAKDSPVRNSKTLVKGRVMYTYIRYKGNVLEDPHVQKIAGFYLW